MQISKSAAVFFSLGALATSAGAATPGPEPKAVLSEAIGALLQADGPKERHLLTRLEPSTLSAKQAELRTCMLARLDGGAELPPPADPFVRKVLDTYRAYWREAMRTPPVRAAAERQLIEALTTLLDRPDLKNIDAVEPVLTARLGQAGYHAILGRTGVLQELMLWSRQDDRAYTVALPEGTHVTHVFLLNDFASMG